jgi:periplasmic protein TonB
MHADSKVQATATSGTARARPKRGNGRERAFVVALSIAAVAHIALIAGFVRALPQRQMGEKSGRTDGVSVAMVDAADLASQGTFAERAQQPRPRMQVRPAPPTPSEVARVEEQPQEKTTPRPKEQPAPELVSPDEAALQGKEGREQKLESVPWPIDLNALEQGFSPDRPVKPRDAAVARQTAKPPEQRQTASASPLQLTLPDSAIPLEELFSYSRPAGYTRSGENDEFGRAVIRALRKTMPDMSSTRGRVPVRLVVSQNGNLAELRLARSSGNPLLDQAVMFAVQQTSFPFPPPNAPPIDRTFLVTYIYEQDR